MSKIFQEQTALRIQLSCGQDVTDAHALQIKYRKPDGITGEWNASVSDAPSGIIYHDVNEATELDQTGWWWFWAFVTFSDDRSAHGEPVRVKVYPVGE